MKRIVVAGFALALLGSGASAFAQDAGKKMPMDHGTPAKGDMKRMDRMHGMDAKAMDTNAEGMISREEFMKHHEAMYDGMKKGSNGMVAVKDMGMMTKKMPMHK